MVIIPFSDISFAYSSYPFSLMNAMQENLSERKTSANSFDMTLLNFLQSFKSSIIWQSTQLVYEFSMQQVLILHQAAFTFSLQPGHFPLNIFYMLRSKDRNKLLNPCQHKFLSFFVLLKKNVSDQS